jgi:hypothetical protein
MLAVIVWLSLAQYSRLSFSDVTRVGFQAIVLLTAQLSIIGCSAVDWLAVQRSIVGCPAVVCWLPIDKCRGHEAAPILTISLLVSPLLALPHSPTHLCTSLSVVWCAPCA